MWLNENLIKFIESSADISKTTIFISNLRKIRLSTIPNKPAKKLDELMSRELLENLLVIGTGIEQDKYLIINSKSSTIPLLNENDDEPKFSSQIILPLWVDNDLYGCFIMATQNRLLDDYDLELARSIQIFIEESIINFINDDYLKETEKKKNKSLLKKDKESNSIADNFDSSNNNINNLSNASNKMTDMQ